MAFILLFLALALWLLVIAAQCAGARGLAHAPPDAALPVRYAVLLAGGPIQFNMLVCHWSQSLGCQQSSAAKQRAWHCAVALIWAMNAASKRVKLFQMLFRGAMCEGASLLYKRTAEKPTILRRYWTAAVSKKLAKR